MFNRLVQAIHSNDIGTKKHST
uniref:Uncharacterized protein n=1 Tax=Rhizophora mucronata TaxID=61149 RepID=A0A2P2NI75_RHIMU